MTSQRKRWRRHRFKANEDDFRPVRFPPPGPYWCTGYSAGFGDGYSIVVAYLPAGEPVTKWWPEATDIETTEEESITYTDRFQKPEWVKV